jgi:hypothetical protein
MQAGLSCNSLGAFFGGFFLGLGAEEFHELAQGLAGPVTWGAWPDEAAGVERAASNSRHLRQTEHRRAIVAALRRDGWGHPLKRVA